MRVIYAPPTYGSKRETENHTEIFTPLAHFLATTLLSHSINTSHFPLHVIQPMLFIYTPQHKKRKEDFEEKNTIHRTFTYCDRNLEVHFCDFKFVTPNC